MSYTERASARVELKHYIAAAILICLPISAATAVPAQENEETIVVTATRTITPLAEVPESVSVLSGIATQYVELKAGVVVEMHVKR